MSTAGKNPREGTRSPRTGHELKRTYDMMEGARGHPGREAAPFEGYEVSTEGKEGIIVSVIKFQVNISHAFCFFFSGLISRALPRDGPHPDSKERPILAGSIMQGWWRDEHVVFWL